MGELAWMVASEPSWPEFMAWRHIQSLSVTAHLTQKYAVGSKMQGMRDKCPHINKCAAFASSLKDSFERHPVGMRKRDFKSIFDRDDTVLLRDDRRHGV